MERPLAGRSAIVTGAAHGIGRATAREFGARGMRVGCLDTDAKALEATVAALRQEGLDAEAILADVSSRQQMLEGIHAFAKDGSLSALVNNAVYIRFGSVADMQEEHIDRMLAVGIKGLYWGVQASLPFLIKAAEAYGDAAIVNVSSAAAVQGTTNFSTYTAVKSAVAGLTRQFAVELGPNGIRTNAVAPGPIPTENVVSHMPNLEGWRGRTIRKTPLGRMGRPEEIASAIAFLATPESSWVNGELILLDGGKSIAAHDRGEA